ncbi:MAG: hypothetical protein SGARI_006897, partial [Bacillariaceae sp.]
MRLPPRATCLGSTLLVLCSVTTIFLAQLSLAFVARDAGRRIWHSTTTRFSQLDADDKESNNNVLFEFASTTPNPDVSPGTSEYYESLRSSYPPDTPAGLRGEAIRSALVTTERCLVWCLQDDFGDGDGVLHVEGKGTLDFLHNKLTADFVTPITTNNNIVLDFQEACLLDAKGRLVDWLRVSTQSGGNNPQAWILTSP